MLYIYPALFDIRKVTNYYIKNQEHLMKTHHQIDTNIVSMDVWITKEVRSPGGRMDPEYIPDQDCWHPSRYET